MATSSATQTPSDRPQLSVELAPETSGIAHQTADEEAHLLGLPVELQKEILEYIRSSVLGFNRDSVS
jgi:hypothetical protein